MALDPYQSLFQQNVVVTPDGRYFLPFSKTYAGQKQQQFDENGNPVPFIYGADQGYGGDPQYFSSLQDYYNFADPGIASAFGDPGRQTVLNLDTTGMGLDQINTLRGTYNGDIGYYFDPNRVVGAHPVRAGGKPNESGLWQALALMLPAAGGIGSFALDQAAAGATSLGTEAGTVAGDVGGNIGTSTLAGSAGGVDTTSAISSSADQAASAYPSSGLTEGEAGTLYGGGNGATGMDNYFGDYITDPETGDVVPSSWADSNPQFDPYTGDQAGYSGNFSGGGTNDFYDPFAVDAAGNATGTIDGVDWSAIAKKYGPGVANKILNYVRGQSGNTVGQGILGQLTGDPLGSAFSALPFLLALKESDRQSGDINNAITRMHALEDSVSGNASPYMRSILDPYDMATAAGRTNLMQDQLLRGVRGSSFGDQSINIYDYTRGLGRGDIAARALQGSTALQGNLINSELGAVNARNTNRNLLLGAGLSASGKLFSPQQEPFNLATLLGLGGSF